MHASNNLANMSGMEGRRFTVHGELSSGGIRLKIFNSSSVVTVTSLQFNRRSLTDSHPPLGRTPQSIPVSPGGWPAWDICGLPCIHTPAQSYLPLSGLCFLFVNRLIEGRLAHYSTSSSFTVKCASSRYGQVRCFGDALYPMKNSFYRGFCFIRLV